MALHTEHGRESGARECRALLTMARELMQAETPRAVLELAGRSIAELAHVDSALLLVRGEVRESVCFDRAGKPRQAAPSHPWYSMALARLEGASDAIAMAQARPMLVGVPSQRAMAVLAVGWGHSVSPAGRDERRGILVTVLELAVAALGRISSRTSLEQLLTTQYQQMADSALAHAEELARRDESEGAVRALALTDVLTGLNNRRGFYVQAEHLFKVARRKNAACSVIYADIDGLKMVNDRLGHAAGDRMIQDAGAALRASLRDSDVLARLGGDEFVAFVLDDTDPRVMLCRLQDKLHAFNLMQERSYRLAVSAGAVCCDLASDKVLADYVELADREMYLHKQSCLRGHGGASASRG